MTAPTSPTGCSPRCWPGRSGRTGRAGRPRRSSRPAQRSDGALAHFLLEGKALFDAYRAKDTVSTTAIRDRRTEALERQNTALIVVFASYLVLLGATGVVTVRRRRRLQETVLAPIEDLHQTIGRLRGGDLSARAAATSVPELAEIGTALGRLATELDEAGTAATDREIRLAFLANRFETVVRVGREIAGSLSIRYVSSTVTTAAADLLGTSTTLWLRGGEQGFHATHRSSDPHGVAAPASLTPPPVVLTAAADALPATAGDRRAYPLVLAGMVTAVLEVETPIVDDDTEQVLTSLLSTAAAALESAHLHSTAREQAEMDGLTHLPNRRRFEHDIDAEWERCRRYGRPLSLVMMDLDHFKRLNDEHGHLLGDQVLREVADGHRPRAALDRHGLPVRRRGDRRAAPRDRPRGRGRGRRTAADGGRRGQHRGPPGPVGHDLGRRRRPALHHVALHRAGRPGRQGALRGQAAGT